MWTVSKTISQCVTSTFSCSGEEKEKGQQNELNLNKKKNKYIHAYIHIYKLYA